MSSPRVSAIRSVHLGVPDLTLASGFYGATWGLKELDAASSSKLLRAAGDEHHVLQLEESSHPAILGVSFAADDVEMVHALYQNAKGFGVDLVSAPLALSQDMGGGFGFTLRTPDGLPLTISAGTSRHQRHKDSGALPHKLAHVVLNSADVDKQFRFFRDVLGFKLSDSNGRMEFIRCNADHHSVALAKANGLSLNHMAFELPDFNGLMCASGRVKQNGYELDWGVGRHGAGNNIFSYFVDPMGFVAEFTTEVEQIDDETHVPRDAEYWATATLRPCRWGMAMTLSDRIKKAMAGDFQLDPSERIDVGTCDEVIARGVNS